MSGSATFSSQFNLANLTAPATGTTHAVKFNVVLAAGQSVVIDLTGYVDQIGDFAAQAMTVDNSSGATNITVSEQFFGWQRVIQAGSIQTFQYPAVPQQRIVVSSTGAVTPVLTLYDWPAFPDGFSQSGSGSSNVNVLTLPAVTQGTSPWITQRVPSPPTYSWATSISVGALPTDFFVIQGSATKTVTITSIILQASAASFGSFQLAVFRRSSANTGGTFSAIGGSPFSTASSNATAVANAYTAAPTSLGTQSSPNLIYNIFQFDAYSGSGTIGPVSVYTFGNDVYEQPISIIGSTSYLAFNLGGVSVPSSATIYLNIKFQEQ